MSEGMTEGKSMHIVAHDKGTYLVPSRTRDGHHIVDITERTCSCERFNDPRSGGFCPHLDIVNAMLAPALATKRGSVAIIAGARKGRLCAECGRRPARKQRTKCNTCRAKAWEESNPLRRLYSNLKSSAKKRGKKFTLSFERLEEIAKEAGWIYGANRKRDGLSIDRKDPRRGYEDDNVRVMAMWQNAARHHDRQAEAEGSQDGIERPF